MLQKAWPGLARGPHTSQQLDTTRSDRGGLPAFYPDPAGRVEVHYEVVLLCCRAALLLSRQLFRPSSAMVQDGEASHQPSS